MSELCLWAVQVPPVPTTPADIRTVRPMIAPSMEERGKVKVTIEVYDPFKCFTLIGRVTEIDVLGRRTKPLISEIENWWVNVNQIMKIY